MKKTLILFIMAAFMLLPTIFALNLNVTSQTQNAVLIRDINQPTSFNISITNYGNSNSFLFYNLAGFDMTPKNAVSIANGETKTVTLTLKPVSELPYKGYYIFNYFIRTPAGESVPESLTFKIIDLKDAFSVGASEINPQSSSIKIYIKNNIASEFDNLDVNFKSPFFTLEKTLSLAPNGQKFYDVTLNRADFKSLLAGFYTLSADVTSSGKTVNVEGNIKFSEQDLVNVSDQTTGFIIYTHTIQKTNTGNVIADSQTVVKKNIISRLFTTFTPEPDYVDRKGLTIDYTWENKIQPGETVVIKATTNWLLPLFVILFIVAIVIIVKMYSRTSLTMDKKVTFLRAKGGEFALKVTVVVSAKKFVERITVTERLPALVRLYEKFGTERPSKVDEKNKRLEWYFDHLEEGESRVINYIIYSKVGVLGRFALPTTSAIYERDGKIFEAQSNRAFLVAEQSAIRGE